MTKLIYHADTDEGAVDDKKYKINFFGLFEAIRCNVLNNEPSNNSSMVNYHFDYPYFSEVVNPEFFEEELNNRQKTFIQRVVLLWLLSSTAICVSVGLVYSSNLVAVLAFLSFIFLILSSIFFFVGVSFVFFEPLIQTGVVSYLASQPSVNTGELEKRYENLLEPSNKEVKCHDQKSVNLKKNVIKFFMKKINILAIFKFVTNGEELIQAGVAMVNMLLLKGVHPNDIILDTNSLGGGIAAEVMSRFEKQGIFLMLIHSNSYTSFKTATNNVLCDVGGLFSRWISRTCLNILFKYCSLDFNSKEIIEHTKCPVLISNKNGDSVIKEPAQLAFKLSDSIGDRTFRLNVMLEHDPNINCKSENIHADCEEHFVIDCAKNETFVKSKEYFCEYAYGYLKTQGLNDHFNLEEYKKSKLSTSLNEKIELINIKTKESPALIQKQKTSQFFS